MTRKISIRRKRNTCTLSILILQLLLFASQTLLPVTLIAEITSEEALVLSRIDYSTYKSLNDVSVTFRAKPRHSFRVRLKFGYCVDNFLNAVSSASLIFWQGTILAIICFQDHEASHIFPIFYVEHLYYLFISLSSSNRWFWRHTKPMWILFISCSPTWKWLWVHGVGLIYLS